MPKFFAFQIAQHSAATFARTAAGRRCAAPYGGKPHFGDIAAITAAHGVPVRVANNANT